MARLIACVCTAWQRFRKRQEGLTMLEYGALAAFLLLILVSAVTFVGPQLRDWLIDTMTDLMAGRGR